MTRILGVALAILTGHACAAGRSTLDEMPAPVRSTFVHAYLADDDPDRYSELFLEPATIDKFPGAIVTIRVNDGKEVQQAQHRFLRPANDVSLCRENGSALQHVFGGEVVQQTWQVIPPVWWDERRRPHRQYPETATPLDIIGTELCLAHFATFSDDLQERTTASMTEQLRQGEERSAAKQARHEADVTTLRGCLRDRDEIAQVSEADERQTLDLNSTSDRLAVARASLELQQTIIDSYEASASSRNDYNREVRAYSASAAEHDRRVKAHARVLERHQADAARVDAACSGREFVGTAAHEVCRKNPSPHCETIRNQR